MNIARRRARPLLGTLIEIGVMGDGHSGADAAIDAGFAVVEAVEAQLSCFRPDSDIGRFHALRPGSSIDIGPHTAAVLAAAADLQAETGALFDISLGSGPHGWHCDGQRLRKLDPGTRLDLGGIGKGYAVDRAIEALRARIPRGGWVNAGGDLRAYGAARLDVLLRDEEAGGARTMLRLDEGAVATSRFADDSRCRLHRAGCGNVPGAAGGRTQHVSVAAPQCLWADALTKVVAASGDLRHPALHRRGARAWSH